MTKSFVAFRIATTLTALTVLAQAITAGMLLSFPDGRLIHARMALTVLVATLATLITAILVWRPGGGSASHIAPTAVLFVLAVTQVGLGMAGVALVHVPLGVLLWGGVFMLARRGWQKPDTASAIGSATAPATTP